MPRKRKHHSAEFKARAALEAVKGVKTVQQLGKDFQAHPTQITIWKKQLTGQVAELFKREARSVLSADDEELRQAYEKIGRLAVKLDWLKNPWASPLSTNAR
jgi:transposase-like protein